MRRFAIFIGILLFVCAPGAYAANYYVDQSAGSDSNTGTSPTTAWKNCPGMSSYSGSGILNPGDTVYFDSAGTWLVTGTQGLYLIGGVTYLGDSWGAGTRATIRANADLEAGVIRFRDHPTTATIFKGFDVDANGKVATGIDINHAFYSLMTGATKRVQRCIVRNVWSSVRLGQYKYGIIVSNHGGTGGYADNVEILDTVVHDVSRDAICLYPGDENSSCRIRNVTVRGCVSYNTGLDPDYCCGAGILVKGYVQDAYIEYNYAHDTKGATLFVNGNETFHYPGIGPTNIHVRHNIFTNATVHGAIRIYDGPSGGDPKDVKIYGNIVYNSTVNAGFLIDSDLKNVLSLLVYNNTFYNAPVIINSSAATVSTFNFSNNIVYHTAGVPVIDADGKMTAHLNNIYFRGTGTLVSSRGTGYTAATLGAYEASASSSNPLFKSIINLPAGFTGNYPVDLAPDKDGLSLQQSSYGVDHGISLPGIYNGSINSVPRPAGSAWDIGAYEFAGARPKPPSNLRVVP